MSFEQALAASGLRPRVVIADGRWRRCATDDKPRKKNGAYVLHPDGRGYFKNWATDLDLNKWEEAGAQRATQIDPAVVQRRREEERAYRIKAMAGARARWAESRPMRGLHPYLEAKGLTAAGCAGLRVFNDLLVVPVWFGQSITSIQTIDADGNKRFWPGAPVKAGAYVMDRKNAAVTAICEGLATGLAVYQSVRSARVLVAFDAGNLVSVVDRLRPTGNVVICADNDHATQARTGINPGIQKATGAAELIGAGVAYPKGIQGSDWADALAEWPNGARRIEREILAGGRYIMT